MISYLSFISDEFYDASFDKNRKRKNAKNKTYAKNKLPDKETQSDSVTESDNDSDSPSDCSICDHAREIEKGTIFSNVHISHEYQ